MIKIINRLLDVLIVLIHLFRYFFLSSTKNSYKIALSCFAIASITVTVTPIGRTAPQAAQTADLDVQQPRRLAIPG